MERLSWIFWGTLNVITRILRRRRQEGQRQRKAVSDGSPDWAVSQEMQAAPRALRGKKLQKEPVLATP